MWNIGFRKVGIYLAWTYITHKNARKKKSDNTVDEGLGERLLNGKGNYNKKTRSFLKGFKLYTIFTKCNSHNNNKIVGLNSVNNELSSGVKFQYRCDLVYDRSFISLYFFTLVSLKIVSLESLNIELVLSIWIVCYLHCVFGMKKIFVFSSGSMVPHAKILQFLLINWWKFLVCVSLCCYKMQYILHLDLTSLFMKIGLLPEIIFVWFCFVVHNNITN